MSLLRRNYYRSTPPTTNYLSHETKVEVVEPQKKGPFANIRQIIYKPLESKKRSSGEFIIEECLEGIEVVPGKIYRLSIPVERFIKLMPKDISNPRMQEIDNYYLYNYVYSIKDGIGAAYQEEELEYRWNVDESTYQRKIRRVYLDDENDLNTYRDYHLIVRVYRFQINQKIYEIVTKDREYVIPKNCWRLLLENNLSSLNLPSDTEFIIRQSKSM